MFRRLLSGTVLALVLSAGPAFAHEHKVIGTVTMAAADHVMVRTMAGKEVTVKISAGTKVTRGKEVVKSDTVRIASARRIGNRARQAVRRVATLWHAGTVAIYGASSLAFKRGVCVRC